MASLTWAMATEAAGQIAEVIQVPNRAQDRWPHHADAPRGAGRAGGVGDLARRRGGTRAASALLKRGGVLSPATVRVWFHRLSTSLKMEGCASYTGRRTCMTRTARTVSQVGGSLRDVQELADHTSLAMTQRSIEGDTEAKRKLVALLYRGLVRNSGPHDRYGPPLREPSRPPHAAP
jgi:integrase/recombinase XerC